MRELRVEDALMYLDQVKMEFGDRPHIYNEFLDIMKSFKSQQIDTPGVIRRVSALFHGNKKLVLGFNTFLPDGYKIELPMDGNGTPIAVYRAPGQTGVTQILGPGLGEATAIGSSGGGGTSSGSGDVSGPPAPAATEPSTQQHQKMGSSDTIGSTTAGPSLERSSATTTTASSSQMQSSMSVPTSASTSRTSLPPKVRSSSVDMGQHDQQQQTGMYHPPTTTSSGIATSQVQIPQQQQPPPPQHIQQPKQPIRQEKQRVIQQQPPSPQPPPQQQQQNQGQGQQQQGPVEFDHAINYVTTIKKRFASEPDTYKSFLDILHTYQKEQRGIKEVLDEVSTLFADHPDLLREFTYFLPDAVQAQAKAQLTEVAKAAEARNKRRAAEAAAAANKGKRAQQQRPSHPSPPPKSSNEPMQQQQQGMAPQQQQVQQQQQAPVVQPAPIPFGASQGRTEEREREICRSAIYGVITFAPVRPPRKNTLTPSQCAQKFGRPRTIPELPLQPTVAESAFLEKAKLHLTRKELAPDKLAGSRRHTPHAEFLKCMHLFGANLITKDELVLLLRGLFMQGHAPKSGIHAGGGSSNPIIAAAANDLMKELDKVLLGRGPYAEQVENEKNSSKYGCMSIRDFEWSDCKNPTSSYYTYPSDYPKDLFLVHSGQTDEDRSVLNNSLICYNYKAKKTPTQNPNAPSIYQSSKNYYTSPEEYDGPKIRRNIYEETMFKIEEERFEVDMAIERNLSAMRQMEPLAEEASILKEGEEKDGQPIGRMQYKLRHRSLGSTHIGSIARVYGDGAGDEVVHHLLQNPIAVLPIVYKRLLGKDSEWRKVRINLTQHWRKVTDSNCDGSLDVTCYFYRKELERSFMMDWLIEECQRARHYYKHPRKLPSHPVTASTCPSFHNLNTDRSLLLFQPHIALPMNKNMAHKEVYNLVSAALSTEKSGGGGAKSAAKTLAEKEKVSRVWAEFIAPWFDLPIYWFLDELRERKSPGLTSSSSSSRGDKGNVVKYAAGQRVRTAYGDGIIQSHIESNTTSIQSRYKIKYPFGIGYIRPHAIVYTLPSDNADEKKSLQVMFATEKLYIFLRLYTLFVLLLTEAKQTLDTKTFYQILQFLKSYKKDEISFKMYEMKCRSLSPSLVCKFAALPRLLEKCCDFIIKVVKEDALLSLYDLSQFCSLDLTLLRTMSFEVTSEATYRIQYIQKEEKLCFMFLNFDTDMIVTTPRSLLLKDQDVMEDNKRSDSLLDDNVIVSSRGPPSKRLKIKL